MRSIGQLIALLLVIGFIGAYFWWIIAATAVVAAVRALRHLWPRPNARIEAAQADHTSAARRIEAERRAIARRADEQHAWALAGDERGTCAAYPPAAIGD